MARNKSFDEEVLIKLLDEYRSQHYNKTIKIPEFGKYVREQGYDIQDYTIRRDARFREYLEKTNEEQEENVYNDLVTYQTIDVEAFIRNNGTKEKMKAALINRDTYFANIANKAIKAIDKKRKAEAELEKAKKKIEELEEKLEKVQVKTDNKKLKEKDEIIKKLKGILSEYIYPDVANAFLEKEGILDVVNEIVSGEQLENVTMDVNTNINKFKHDSVNKLMDGFEG